MSTPDSSSASYSASPPFQSAQHQEEQEFALEDRLVSSVQQSPRSHDGSTTTRLVEDAVLEVTVDDDASSGSVYTPERHTPHQTPHMPSPPRAGNNTVSGVPPSRPNKYHGPPSTWRNWTAAERELAASLQQLTANDLSVHLYNAFHLQRRPEKLRQQVTKHYEGGVEGAEAWLPPKVWTAWPLPPEIVPREADILRWEEEGNRPGDFHGRRDTPIHNLKELLVGHVLEKAKERFWAREWEDDEPDSADGKPSRELGSRSGQSNDDSEEFDSSPPRAEHTSRESSSSARAEVDDDNVQPHGAEVSPRAERATRPSGDHWNQNLGGFEPEIMIDDDKASDILEPTMNHVLAKFDNLLMGLHHARSAYMALDDSASESHQDFRDPPPSQQEKGKRSKPRQRRGRPRSNGKSSVGSAMDIAGDSRPSSTSRTRSQRPSSSSRKAQSFQNRKARVGLRDWSDILGIASMTGWESAVVEKAATRCAALFDEGISFRTLHEGTDQVREDSYLPRISKRSEVRRLGKGFPKDKRLCQSSDGSNPGSSDEGFVELARVDTLLQPVEAERHWKRNKSLRRSRRQSRPSRK